MEAVNEIVSAIEGAGFALQHTILEQVRGIMRSHKLEEEDLQDLIDIIYEVLSPIATMNTEYDTSIHQMSQLAERQMRFTSIATSSMLETRPDKMLKFINELNEKGVDWAEQRKRNVLILSDPKITEGKKDEYIGGLDALIKNYTKQACGTEYSLHDIYDVEENVLTLEDFEDESDMDNITEDTALQAALSMAFKMVEEAGTIVIIGGNDNFAREIGLATIIRGVLHGKPEYIREALKLLGKDDGTIDINALRSQVLDLRGYTSQIQAHRRAIRNLKQAL